MLVSSTPHLRVHRLYAHNSLRNYTYVLVESAKARGWAVDPWDAAELLEWAEAEGVVLSGFLNTHGHHDHVRGNAGLEAAGVPRLERFPDIGGVRMEDWAAPGHTADHRVFLVEDGERHFFAGDTLFQAGVGNCKNGGDPECLFESVLSLKGRLDPGTFLHPGHDYLERNLGFALRVEPGNERVGRMLGEVRGTDTTIRAPHPWALELEINPFLRTDRREVRAAVESETGPLASGMAGDEIVFKTLRRWRDQW